MSSGSQSSESYHSGPENMSCSEENEKCNSNSKEGLIEEQKSEDRHNNNSPKAAQYPSTYGRKIAQSQLKENKAFPLLREKSSTTSQKPNVFSGVSTFTTLHKPQSNKKSENGISLPGIRPCQNSGPELMVDIVSNHARKEPPMPFRRNLMNPEPLYTISSESYISSTSNASPLEIEY